MLKEIFLFCFFWWSTSCFSQESDSAIRSRVYSPNVYWISDSAYCCKEQKYYSNGRPLGEFEFNENGQLVRQKQYSFNGELLTDAWVYDFDGVRTEFELLYTIFLSAKTYYENGNLRTDLNTTRRKMKSEVFNSDGKRMYSNLVKNPYSDKADTVKGVFRTFSWYTWIEYQIYANGEVDFIFIIPLKFKKVAINEPESAEERCKNNYCVTYVNPKLTKKRINNYQKRIEAAIENDLITSLANCELQY